MKNVTGGPTAWNRHSLFQCNIQHRVSTVLKIWGKEQNARAKCFLLINYYYNSSNLLIIAFVSYFLLQNTTKLLTLISVSICLYWRRFYFIIFCNLYCACTENKVTSRLKLLQFKSRSQRKTPLNLECELRIQRNTNCFVLCSAQHRPRVNEVYAQLGINLA